MSILIPVAAQQNFQNNQQPDFSRVNALIHEQLINNKIPSISIAVIYKGKIILEKAYGMADKEKAIKATINTPYYLASLTKSITATAVLKLSEKKLINLDTSANSYLKNSKLSSHLWNPGQATIKTLLHHTSGLTTYHRDYSMDNAGNLPPLNKDINNYGIIFWKPGDHFDYSNIGYGVLGQIVADVSGKSFAYYLKDQVFSPLGMKDSFLGIDLKNKNIAIRYHSDSLRSRSANVVSYTMGASSAYSSVHDLTKYAMLLLNDKIEGTEKILSDSVINKMETDTVTTGDLSEFYGYGLGVNTDYFGFIGVLGQGGTDDGQAWMQLIPSEDIGVILLANTGIDGDACQTIINESIATILPGFRKKMSLTKKNNEAAETVKALPDSIYGSWVGKIHTASGDINMHLTVDKNGSNYFQLATLPRVKIAKLDYSSRRFFFDVSGNLHVADAGSGQYTLSFELDRKGNKLYGALTANASVQLPFWVELNKQ